MIKGVNRYMSAVLGTRLPYTAIGNKIVIHDSALGEHIDGEISDLAEENERLRRELAESRESHSRTLDNMAIIQRKLDYRNKLLDMMRKYTMVGI